MFFSHDQNEQEHDGLSIKCSLNMIQQSWVKVKSSESENTWLGVPCA